MRITNSMITNSTLLSINRNKQAMYELEQQMSTGKKIQRPSDDPIVAARALKFRTSVSEIDQYSENVKDAISWLDTTEQAMSNMTDILKRVKELCVQGSSDTLGKADRLKIIDELQQLREQIGAEGNVNYAGRYVFTGYKTDTPLVFSADTTEHYEITESFTSDDVETVDRVIDGTPPEIQGVYRIRLGYSGLEDPDNSASVISDISGFTVNSMDSADANAYTPAADEINFLKDTGELIFGADAKAGLPASFDFTYDKTNFAKGDQVPVHYYETAPYAEETDLDLITDKIKVQNFPVKDGSVTIDPPLPTGGTIYYDPSTWDPTGANQNDAAVNLTTGEVLFGANYPSSTVTSIDYQYEVDGTKEQNINYSIGIRQEINVNTFGKNVITTDLLRDMEEIIGAALNVEDEDEDIQALKEDLLGDEFEAMLTKVDVHLEQVLGEEADLGSRMNRLELTQTRLDDDKVNLTDLMSENEDVDMTEVVVLMGSQELVYNASLAATAKILQPTLMDFLR